MNKYLILKIFWLACIVTSLNWGMSHAQAPFITVWNTENPGDSPDDEISLYVSTYNDYNWEKVDDPSINGSGSSLGTINITFPDPGIYRLYLYINTSTTTPKHVWTNFTGSNDAKKLIEIEQWGDAAWTNWNNSFAKTSNLTITATDIPDLSQVSSMNNSFLESGVSTIPNMNDWDVSGITSMANLFSDASNFNEFIGDWDVGNVTNMNNMFNGASSFNQDISDWNVGNVTTMYSMFSFATAFNQNISLWNVEQVEQMNFIFNFASSFNQNLGDWNLSSLTDGIDFKNTGMDCENFSQTLRAWARNPSMPEDIQISATGIEYSPEISRYKTYLEDELNWSITAQLSTCKIDHSFITVWDTENPGVSDNDKIKLYIYGNYDYTWEKTDDISINGSGSSSSGYLEITFPTPGIYRLSITSTSATFSLQMTYASNDAEKLIGLEQWGDVAWSSFSTAFLYTSNLTITATDIPDLSLVESMYGAFQNSGVSNIPNMNDWDVSNVTDMRALFMNAENFNEDISNWDVSSVTAMNTIFSGASSFNQNISSWDVSNATSMVNIFVNANSFNQNLGDWNLNSLTGSISFINSGMDCENYSLTLRGWADNPNIATDITLYANTIEYSEDIEAERDFLITDLNWEINSDALGTCSINLPFVTIWNTSLGSGANDEISFDANGDFDYYWEAVSDPSINGNGVGADGMNTITFPTSGIYRLSIKHIGTTPFSYFLASTYGDEAKLIDIEDWGDIPWSNFSNSFAGTENLNAITASTRPYLRLVEDMSFTFAGSAIATINNIESWDLSHVTDMSFMFYYAIYFNDDIGHWNVSNVSNMYGIFMEAQSFNQDLSAWNISGLIDGITFDNTNMSCENYSTTIQAWAHHSGTPDDIAVSAFNVEYSPVIVTDRDILEGKNWTFTGDTEGTCTIEPLSINIISFEAIAENRSSLLSWEAIVDPSLLGFGIERSMNGKTWTEIGFLPSKTDVESTQKYNFIDDQIIESQYFYRLRLDYEQAHHQYSNVRQVAFGNHGGNIVIYPNPTSHQVNIEGLSGNETISVLDIYGKTIQKTLANGYRTQLDLSAVPNGFYMIQISKSDGSTESRKIIKQ